MPLGPVSRALALAALLALPLGAALAAPGDPIGVPVEVSDPSAIGPEHPDIALMPGGSAVYVWTANDNASGYNVFVMGRRLAADGTALGAEFRIDASTTPVQNPRVAADAAGNFVVVWEEWDPLSNPKPGRIHLRRYAADGTPLSPPLPVDTPLVAAEEQANPAIAMNPQGRFVISWNTYKRFKYGAYWQIYKGPVLARRYAADGTPLADTQVVAERNSGGLYAYVREPVLFTGAGVSHDLAESGPAVDLAPDGSFVVAWTSGFVSGLNGDSVVLQPRVSGGLQSIEVQRFDAAGNKLGRPSQALSLVAWREAHFDTPDVALTPDGGYALTWVQYQPLRFEAARRGTFMRRYDASGKALGLAVEVFRDTHAYSRSQSPSIAVDANGSIIVAMVPRGPVVDQLGRRSAASRVYAADGSALGPMTAAGELPGTVFAFSEARIAVHPNGDYQLTWDAAINVGSSSRSVILTQRIEGP